RKEFINTLDFSLCFSSFTLAHQLVKILLLEQIYRAFCINFNHPYHK
ncbi:23S rRNA (pseudouridine(1915)-N(3))-methyltransferase RlmH, partial [Campylobacter sp. TTU-622]